ncbi:uncharacterized protein MELLADRAFT_89723 [Melampsora larici-populina 98AG31]|uniref:Cytochrome b-c1 complex subunit 8 n=1 Tax=Melampsora larici-populina (strain 98AG31 / pathotype 3-4-7) TaxID=747676 RepID=F4RUD8_MELLP|nr:uncharacterized protein MELLADRAFT_89723 [Melampsora larici-populina 98AG31]EGG03915.1 hypothetical protein MELLADRAFT_89723 [Melampsora larici-populina 98AG31]
MFPTKPSQSAMPTGKHYIGWWGSMGGPKQKGIVQYAISPYRQSPMKNVISHSLFQGYRRIVVQVPYFAFPFAAAYGLIAWADADNVYRNTKAGHAAGCFP